jgi:hypothetical protein
MAWRSAFDHMPSPLTKARIEDSKLKLATHIESMSTAITIIGQVTDKSPRSWAGKRGGG